MAGGPERFALHHFIWSQSEWPRYEWHDDEMRTPHAIGSLHMKHSLPASIGCKVVDQH
jgi:hypothetical protein